MKSVLNLLNLEIGLDPASVGFPVLEAGIRQRMTALGLADPEKYLVYLGTNPGELAGLIKTVAVPETWFFRDKGPFDFLGEQFSKPVSETLRILSLPCSSGEEPYSIAITLLRSGMPPGSFVIDAADVRENALNQARMGVYRAHSFRGEPGEIDETHIRREGRDFVVQPVVKQCVRFHCGNILNPAFIAGFQPFDIVFFRNLLIYLDTHSAQRAVRHIDMLLKPNGILFVGHAETVTKIPAGYRRITAPRTFAFRKPPMPISELSPDSMHALPSGNNLQSIRPRKAVVHIPQTCKPACLGEIRDLADRGNAKQALTLCEAWCKQHPTDAAGFELMGTLLLSINNEQAAADNLKKALYLDPVNHTALSLLTGLHTTTGNKRMATYYLNRLRRLEHSIADPIPEGNHHEPK